MNLLDYLTKPEDGGYKPDASYADMTLHNATVVPRFLARGVKSMYDSFDRLAQPPQFGEDSYLRRDQNSEDALNIALSAMTGSMPFAPKGAGTVGSFKLPSDVVATALGQDVPGNVPRHYSGNTAQLHGLISRYQDKLWGTTKDPVIAHIDKGHRVPNVPGLEAHTLNGDLELAQGLGDRLPRALAKMEQTTNLPLQATTDLGRAVEMLRDRRMRGEGSLPTNVIVQNSRRMPQKTKDYLAANPEARAFKRPDTSPYDLENMPYRVEGNLDRMSMEDYLMKATEQENILAKQQLLKRDTRLYEFDDGSYWTKLENQIQREAESKAMGNSTRLPMHDGKELYSLRDKEGKSILTASRKPGLGFFDEIKTRFNNEDVLSVLHRSMGEHPNTTHVKQLRIKLGMPLEPWDK
jgi:hypothetical protein